MTAEVAKDMDPQQRLVLEVVYEALESAGMTLEGIAGSNTAVFGGVMWQDHWDSQHRDAETLPRYFATGNARAMVANRISHFYDLRGPSITVDTACSTTLTAVHLACQSLRAGEADMAIVAGANLILNPDVFTTMSNLGFLSPDGISYSFDPRANGYGRGEGIAAIVLKAFPSAIAAGDPVRSVIRETAINQDGKTPTITAPSDRAQEDLIRACYGKAGIDTSHTAYVEAHGTGAPTGDPLEIGAISRAFQGQPMCLGSIKANIGHLEAASGVASIIKTALSLEKGVILPHPRFLRPSKSLMLEKRNISSDSAKLPTSVQDWPLKNGIRRASINSFGFGGTNVHLILEWQDWQDYSNGHTGPKSKAIDGISEGPSPARIYILSANDEQACRHMMSNLRHHIQKSNLSDEAKFLASLAYTLGSRRSVLPWTVAFTADSVKSLLSALDSEDTSPTRSVPEIRMGWVFTGQGAQWHAMGRELFATFPVFREAILECDGYIEEMGASWTITEELHRDEATTRVNKAEFSLPLSTAIQIALVRLLWKWGLRPTGITSHSSGEAAAAFAAGALSARSAIGVTYIRGALTARSASKLAGGMMAVGLGRSDADDYISRVFGDQKATALVVGCVNSPSSVTVSGDLAALEKLEHVLRADSVFCRRLKVTQAFHSSHMKPSEEAFRAALVPLLQSNTNDHISSQPPTIYSSPTTGGRMSRLEDLQSPTHWAKSMLQPVEFESAFGEMCWDTEKNASSVDLVLEIGPHGALGGPIQQIMQLPELAGTDIPYLTCLSRGKSALDTMHRVAIEMTQRGCRPDVDEVNFPLGRNSIHVQVLHDLPAYPWSRQTRYWREPKSNRHLRQREHPPHHLIGSRDPPSFPSSMSWSHSLRISDIPWVRDHVVGSAIVLPGAAFITMVLDGMYQAHQPSSPDGDVYFSLRDVELVQALVLSSDPEAEVDLRMMIRSCDERSLGAKGWHDFYIHSLSGDTGGTWVEHCTGMIRIEETKGQPGLGDSTLPVLQAMRDTEAYTNETNPENLWEALRDTGICHGPLFRNISRIESSGRWSLSTFSAADTARDMPHRYESQHIIHPTSLDSVLQAAYCPLIAGGTNLKSTLVPRRLKGMRISSRLFDFGTGSELHALACIKNQGSHSSSADVVVYDESGTGSDGSSTPEVLIEMEDLVLQSLGAGSLHDQRTGNENICCTWTWAPDVTLMDLGRLRDQLSVDAAPEERHLMMDLRRCTIHFIQQAMEQLSAQDAAQLTGHWKKFHVWMQEQLALARADQLGPDSSRWLRDDADLHLHTRTRAAAGSVNGEMLARLGPQLPAMLRGEVEPLELMVEGRLLSRYYGEALKWQRANAQASELIRLVAHKNPRSRILEIGGGTGGCTELIVRALGGAKPVERYDFTDISGGFFEATRERLAEWQDVMTYSVLDIEKDPAGQGFECGSYDMVVACQVLHATSNMKRTLSHVRRLLRPGGKLVLVETTKDQLDAFFTFGMLPGWWLGEEVERQATPSLTPELWHTTLVESGFSGVELEVRDSNDPEWYMASTIMSTATEDDALVLNPDEQSHSDVVLVHGDSPPSSEWLGKLQTAIAARTGSIPEIMSLVEASVVGKTCIFLGETQHSLLDSMGSDLFAQVKSMLIDSRAVLWVSRGGSMATDDPRQALHLGVLRTLRNEMVGKQCVSLDVDPSREPWTLETMNAICQVLQASLAPTGPRETEFEYAERDGVVHVPRAFKYTSRGDNDADVVVVPEPFHQPSHGRRIRMDVGTPGLLDSLYFREEEDDDDSNLLGDWVEIEPAAFGLNFTDIMIAMGQIQLDADRPMGFECAGTVTRLGGGSDILQRGIKVGDRVCALQKGHWATRVRTRSTNVVVLPDGMSFQDAASIPCSFATAYISLYNTANIRRGERVLIHSGAGGVGQAAIMLAQLAGAEVFVTAGTKAKREFVCETFGISPDHVFSSRDDSFVGRIKACTGGRGVDVILNSLAGHLLQAGFDCMAEFGRFVEIGKRDLEQDSRLSMLTFMKNVSFQSVDLLAWERARGHEVSGALQHIMKLLEEGKLRLIAPVSVYAISDLERAFRTMQASQHLGKIVVSASQTDLVPVHKGRPQMKLSSEASYLVVGGLGGIGRSICEWLVDRGARHLIVLSRSKDVHAPFVTSLEQRGCAVLHHPGDVADENQIAEMLHRCAHEGMPRIQGVVQSAMVLRDALLSQMTVEDFNAALRPKVQGSWNLHKLVQDVDFFIMLSSSIGVMGGPGQANYAAASVFQDALAQLRRAQGKPATSIDLGVVKSVGYVANAAGRGISERLARTGFQTLSVEDVTAMVERAIASSNKSLPEVVMTGINTSPGAHWAEERWIQEARFAGLKPRPQVVLQAGPATTPGPDQNGLGDTRAELSRAVSYDDAVGMVLEAMSRKLRRMFGLGEDDVSGSRTLASLGVDSLVAIELRTWLMSQLDVDISIFELMEGKTVADLAGIVVRKLGYSGKM